MTGSSVTRLQCAIVGGGAVAERVHLPAIARCPGIEASVVVDASEDRARRVASQFGVRRAATDYHDIIGQVGAAIVGLPHQLHARVTADLLNAGIPVLVEKPMALTIEECDLMVDAATKSGSVLAVGLLRRCSPSLQWVKRALDAGMLGRILSFELLEGAVYRWPVASPSMFRVEGGGVLADAGSHVLDLVLWWFGDYQSFSYRDDAMGGVEADCLLDIEMRSGARGRVELSRTRDLRNSCIITGELGTIEVGTKTDSIVSVRWKDGLTLSGRGVVEGQPSPTSLVDLFEPQLRQFVAAIRFGDEPVVSGVEGRRSVELLSGCYRSRELWTHPWDAGLAAVTAGVEGAPR
jgi:predicted dehydrogenase